ncbi:MAG: hypothetical protein PVF35_05290 [Gammaproteobacteria bacterium]|jgi:hypothetical protein
MIFFKWITFLSIILVLVVIVFYKPSRILIPEINGVACATTSICIDDMNRLKEAEDLIARSVIEVEDKLGPLKNYPKSVFCSTQECYESFGFEHASAHAIGRSGIVIGPAGWQPHYVKHEIIHYWQAENIGVIRMLFIDDWIIEGMAYALSDDPRPELEQPWQTYRTRFSDWYRSVEQPDVLLAIDTIL